MAYQQGTPASPIDLVQQINTFLVANGWTSDKSAAVGTGWEVHLHLGSVYAHLRAAVSETVWNTEASANGFQLALYLSDGFDTSQPWNTQPTNPPFANGTTNVVGVGMNLAAGPFANYFFFTDAANENFLCVVEKTAGLFEYIGWGTSLVKIGTWTGGPYFFGSSSGLYGGNQSPPPNTPGYNATSNCPGSHDADYNAAAGFVRCDSDSFTGKWIPISDNSNAVGGFTGRSGGSSVAGASTPPTSIARFGLGPFTATSPQVFQWMQTSAIDGRVNLLPILWWVGRDGSTFTSGGYSPIGTVPMIFFSNGVGNGFTPKAIYTIGADSYMMFPNFAVLQVS